MRVTSYLFGVFIILTLGEIYLVSSNEGVVGVNSLESKPVIERWKRYASQSTGKDVNLGLKAKLVLKEKEEEIKKVLEKEKEALNVVLNKKKAEVEEFIKNQKTVILEKKEKIVKNLLEKLAEIRTAVKEKQINVLKKLNGHVKS